MHDVRLRTTQRNEILHIIRFLGLDPLEFEWTDEKQDEYVDDETVHFMVSVLTHRPTGYFCRFGGFRVHFSPGHEVREQTEHRNSWPDTVEAARGWLNELQKEVDAPDLWASIGQEKALSTAASSSTTDNRPFTASEQGLIATKLDEIKGYLLAGQQFSAAQAEYVEREFADLKESSTRIGRKDWLRVLMGVLVGQAINLALDPQKAKGLLQLAGSAFQWVWGVGQNYLPLPQ